MLKVKGHKKWINGHISQTITFTYNIPGTKAHYNKRHIMQCHKLFYLEVRSRSHVKGHRCGGVCVLWMLLVFPIYITSNLAIIVLYQLVTQFSVLLQNEKKSNKKHSENADTSTSVTFDLDVWLYFKVKKAYVIRCRLLYCALVPVCDVCETNSLRYLAISSFFVTFDLHLWPSAYVKVTFTLISRCTLCSCT